ncbi:MAG TPA: hypothetical protein VL728_12965, partial [Cyclobacteriaceae bacterium]|nr:hypothetical protein [Cyclobacteriaceae bacterium]
MPIIIASETHEHPESIATQTSRKSNIENQQYSIATKQEINSEIQFERLFGLDSKFQGEETKIYNCHGLTFVSKRTGIYKDEVINLILNDEYKEIKNRN